MNKNKIIIFGIDSEIGIKTAEVLKKKNYEIIGFSKNLRNKKYINIKCDFEKTKQIINVSNNYQGEEKIHLSMHHRGESGDQGHILQQSHVMSNNSNILTIKSKVPLSNNSRN